MTANYATPWTADETKYQRDFRVFRNIMAGDSFVAAVDAGPHGVDLIGSIVEAVNNYSLLQSKLDRATDALENLETACDKLAATRSLNTYDSMIHRDDARDQLIALDEARREARTTLAAIKGADNA